MEPFKVEIFRKTFSKLQLYNNCVWPCLNVMSTTRFIPSYILYIIVNVVLSLSFSSLPFCTNRSLHVLTQSTISSATQESLYHGKNGSHWSIECNGNIIVSCSCDKIGKVCQFPHMREAHKLNENPFPIVRCIQLTNGWKILHFFFLNSCFELRKWLLILSLSVRFRLVLVLIFVVYSRRREAHIKYPGPDDDVRENIINYDDEGGGEDDMTAFDITPLQIPIGGPMPELANCKMPIMCK